MEDLISVVVPIYKVEKQLDRCIESLVNQTYRNLEIILVDDGSPDKCPYLCDLWAEKDKRISVVHKENGGLSSARNVGISKAKGNYIAFVDSDDYIDSKMYETLYNNLVLYQADVACCGRYRVTKENIYEVHTNAEVVVFDGQNAILELLKGGIIEEAAWDKLYRRELFQGIFYPVGEINEDLPTTVKILNRCKTVVHVGMAYYFYCETEGSITKSKYDPKKRIVLKHLDWLREFVIENCPEIENYVDILQARYCQNILYLLLDNLKTYKKYKADYQIFYRYFRNSFCKRFVLASYLKYERFKGFLILWKVYLYIHALKDNKN